jgi:hypothetical protein
MNSRVPSLDVDIHIVLCDFGRAGLAYVETDPTEADATTVVRNLLHGQYDRPLRTDPIVRPRLYRIAHDAQFFWGGMTHQGVSGRGAVPQGAGARALFGPGFTGLGLARQTAPTGFPGGSLVRRRGSGGGGKARPC